MKINSVLRVTLLSFVILSCNSEQINKEAQLYCDCKTRQYEGKAKPGECPKMLAKLKIKYEYMPAESDLLAQRIAECLAE